MGECREIPSPPVLLRTVGPVRQMKNGVMLVSAQQEVAQLPAHLTPSLLNAPRLTPMSDSADRP